MIKTRHVLTIKNNSKMQHEVSASI